MTNNSTVHEPLFHIVKRNSISKLKKCLIYFVSVFIALALGGVICTLASKGEGNPVMFFTSLFDGVLGTQRKIWVFLQETALLVGVSMAIVPAFKMKFWNLGANGQVLIGGLATVACMYYLGNKNVSDTVIILCSVVASITAGALWAVLPALCKAFFNTNESLLTLMMNYIAEGLVTYFIAKWVKGGSGVLKPLEHGRIPNIYNQHLLIILVCALVAVFITIYLKHSKHGYELSVVGDSPNTAKYIGINVKKVIIRTLVLSGAICGIVGLLLTGAMSYTIGTNTVNNMGFTAIMTTWLARCNPVFIILTCALVAMITKGMQQVRMDFWMTNDSTANLVIGLVYFFIIACAFFIEYKLLFRKKNKKEGD